MAETMAMDIDSFDLAALSAEASQFSLIPGVPSDEEATQFLNRYPLPILFRALDTGGELENLIILVLEKLFSNPVGVNALLQVLPYAAAGLQASSLAIRRMTCTGISKLLKYVGKSNDAVRALMTNNLVLPLVKAITDEDASVASAAAEAVANFTLTSTGSELLFAEKGESAGYLKKLAIHGSSLVRIRIFSMIAQLLGQSKEADCAIKTSGILEVLAVELRNTNDVLVQMNALELLYEICMTPDGSRLLSEGGILNHLISIMGDSSVDPLVHAQSMMVAARLISPEDPQLSGVSKEDAMKMVQIIDTTIRNSEEIDPRVKEAAIDALGRIGISKLGAEWLLLSSPPAAYNIVEAAFSRKGGDLQRVSIHALASIAGSERPDGPLLSEQAENSMKNLIFSELQKSSKWSPADMILWLLQQAYETRLAAYRLIVPMAARSWFVIGICSNKDIIKYLTDPHVEHSKDGMEWRHACCVALSTALATSAYRTDSTLEDVIERLQAAVRKGPFLTREKPEAQPWVATQERF